MAIATARFPEKEGCKKSFRLVFELSSLLSSSAEIRHAKTIFVVKFADNPNLRHPVELNISTVARAENRRLLILADNRGAHVMTQQNQPNQPQQGNKPGQPNPMPNKPGQGSQQGSGGQQDQSANKK
jgi:hypothetical protein